MTEEIEKIECLIIGSGPAGYTAAIYAARADMHPVVIQGLQPGGQLTTTTDVDNYPGYKDGVTGPEMMEDFKAQAERFGTDTRWGMVTKVDFSKRPFEVEIDEKTNVLAQTVIIATGINLSWIEVGVVLIATSLAIAVPAAPGAVGTYHAAAVYALTVYFSVERVEAQAFAVLLHAVGSIPLAIIGFIYFLRSSVHIKDISGQHIIE
jgi:NADPH-dependent 2,4-dienoyl-CoA reductase/sulfur reductase-like enzyme